MIQASFVEAVAAYIAATDARVEALRAYIQRLHAHENADHEFAVVCDAENTHHEALLDLSSVLPAAQPAEANREAVEVKCWCGHRESSHDTSEQLDDKFPKRAPHSHGHCRSCCDPESDSDTRCEHSFKAESIPAEANLLASPAWIQRVEHGDDFALVVEWPGEPPHGRYWWVLCPASATLVTDVPSVEDDPTNPDEHEACSIGSSCDFFELHVLAHQAIRERAALSPQLTEEA